jgi:putative acetyltransferase
VVEGLVIGVGEPQAGDVQELVARHLAFARDSSPPESVHALGWDALAAEAALTVYSARADGLLLAIGALRELDPRQGEIKSMHTAPAARRSGVGRALLAHLVTEAYARGYHRLSLETGSQGEFAAARALYASAGFVECGPFGAYRESSWSVFMTRELS